MQAKREPETAGERASQAQAKQTKQRKQSKRNKSIQIKQAE